MKNKNVRGILALIIVTAPVLWSDRRLQSFGKGTGDRPESGTGSGDRGVRCVRS